MPKQNEIASAATTTASVSKDAERLPTPPTFARPAVRFRLGDRAMSVPAGDVLYVALPHDPLTLPESLPPNVVGLTLWQGRVVPMVASAVGEKNESVTTQTTRLLYVRLTHRGQDSSAFPEFSGDAQIVALRTDELIGIFEQSVDWPTLFWDDVLAVPNEPENVRTDNFARQAQ